MREKKSILLYCAELETLSITTFALQLHPYEITGVSDSNEAVLLAGDRSMGFDCAILVHGRPGDLAGRIVHRVLERASRLPLLLIDRAGDLAPIRHADIVLYGHNTTMAHILAALEVLCSREPEPPSRRNA